MTEEKQMPKKSDSVWAVLAYLSVLLLLPLLKRKKSAFVSYHVNQGLVLLVLEFCCSNILLLLGGMLVIAIPSSYAAISTVLLICGLFFLLCHVVGIVHACCRKKRGVPILGEIRLYHPERKKQEDALEIDLTEA